MISFLNKNTLLILYTLTFVHMFSYFIYISWCADKNNFFNNQDLL